MGINEDNYILLQGWMRTELGLSGNELLAYALIYGFSQEENSWCSAGLQYITDWLGVSSKQRTREVIQRLLDKNLIIKQDEYYNNVKFCKYRTSRHAVAEKATPTVAEKATNNNIYNNKETTPIGVVKKAEQTSKILPLENRQEQFRQSLIPFVQKFGREMIRAFYDYWSEPTLDRKKMRWELEKTFELNRRLGYWYRRSLEH